ncbi:PLD nuclease N-terminal domain-containing protein [Pseudomonas japonica]|uniref:PLD nuclease N-terminal domain-containing protein n=1 Tax=Pseudomonas japonica TaxID=256466 RepID=UPI0015E2B99F|nr:PLD nuclease N-terminal domain-containing protein [Pseudomonas japonica]MBA1245010.1 PLDc_N domain-containing protein [Pseudomonas japonica]MBA1290780.1 PLDc_N domain-containing protein [Pseudomonas japonica]
MDSLLSGLIGLVILLADIWAIVSVWRSDKASGTKVGWTVLIFILPVVGLVIWGIMGPRALNPGPSSPTHSKG